MQPSQEEPPDLHIESTVTFDFPTIPVHGTPAHWLSQSQLITMASHHDDSSCDEASSSLGDSTYEFIDDRSVVTTDDEDQDVMTESTTSSGGHDFDRSGATTTDRHLHQRHGQDSQGGVDSGSSSTDSPVLSTAQPYRQGDGREEMEEGSHDQVQNPIEFDEPSVTNLNSMRFTDVSHLLRIVGKDQILDPLSGTFVTHPPGMMRVTVRQTMISRSLDLHGSSYKVLFIGDHASKDSIVQKIGTALAATIKCSTPDSEKSGSSKFNVVPISSFGDSRNPEVVLIDSSGLELIVEDCLSASFERREGGNDTIKIGLSDGRTVESSWVDSKFTVSDDWKLPDIAVFCVPRDEDSQSKQTRCFARSFMSRHAVQSIIISKDAQWEKPGEAIPLDYLTPHICLEYRAWTEHKPQIVRRLPIDLTTFLSIDAGQMNRNLATLAVAKRSAMQPKDQQGAKAPNRKDTTTYNKYLSGRLLDVCSPWYEAIERHVGTFVGAAQSWTLLALLLFAAMFLVQVLLGGPQMSSSRVIPTDIAMSSTLSQSMLSSTVPLSLPSSSALPASLSPSVPAHVSPVKSLSTNTDIASFLLDAYALASNKSEQFKVHVLGDCHVVFRPPHWFTKMKKSPVLFFKIARKDQVLEHKVSTLFDGVYALQIAREEAYGTLDVSVWTESKPLVKKNFEVDFGSSWLKVAAWKRATRALTESMQTDFILVQTSLSTVYNHTKTELSIFVQQTKKKVAAQKEAEKAVLANHLKWGAKTKDLILTQTKDLARSWSGNLHNGRRTASSQLHLYRKSLAKDLTIYIHNKTSMIAYQARTLAQAATGTDAMALKHEIRQFHRRHLRDTQKKVLKTWWKIAGEPTPGKMNKCDMQKRARFRTDHEMVDGL